ncbi:TPA: TonB-dependent receptor plug domain-containing protein [Haemophilus influenzae]|uniref:TonB-dependent receptor plug domain-containing protein n=1 Tax=Haemophilus influenzae TaxID=727 RepID=UPI000DD483BB|nr:TonB-dependent receptor plug domain-containing protein [Haemophilus influenzae]MCK8885631.1 TonB-dependent receptor plug domain-containing protein [Haemophilus influenzae]MCK8938580.1 TonB-dependent receptor plug domain-containing protein [Haemophilus influenzae]MCK9053830.1 TonB-dependent receptor plug domain-containing protein [Haemophilus influenzae]MCK9102637.1 TonB-dependent receptor plug domain-containing protein [Haemophilus influenzae]MCK9145707.1 TonB-dependent receptor plug domain
MYQKKPLMLLFCSTFVSPFVMGKTVETTNNQQPTTNKNILPEIVVYGDNNKSLSSVKTLSSDEISKTPTSNGNITDYLRSNPHIRYENSDQNGFQRGEIKPENISINGADPNQTAYFVDNVNINNDLAIDNSIFDGAMQVVPGISHTQAYFFDATMLSKVEVQDSNISASLGGFMGGAVIAKTKQYSGTDSIKLKYRTTNSSWAKMEAGDSVQKILKQVRPDDSGAAELQPKYNKQTFNILAEKRLNDNLGMVLGYSRRTSSIEQNRLIGFDKDASNKAQLDKQNHQRLSDNLLLNFNWTPQEKERIEFGLRYSNYKELKYFKENIGNNVSDYHQALGATLAWVHSFDSGVWTNTLAYDRFQDKRKSSSNNVETTSVSDEDYEPLYNFEKGGYGNSRLTQDNLHFSTEYVMDPFYLASTEHSISIGGIYQATKYQFYRPQDVHQKVTLIMLNKNGKPITETLLSNSTTSKGRVKTSYQNIGIYAEDLIKWRKFEFRPGIRIERDDYLKNNNIAPRFVARYHPWDNTGFTLGLNRYYGRSFASLKLANRILKINDDSTRQHQNFSSLKSPYADELSLSFDQNMSNLALKLGYIHRDNKNRIILKRETVNRMKKSSYINGRPFGVDIYTFQLNNIEPWKLGKTYWTTSLGFDWLNTKRADVSNEFDPNELVYLDGKLMTRSQMLQQVNSSTEDWIARLGIDMTIPDYDITWSNKVYMKAPIRSYEELDGDNNDDTPRYRSYHYGRHTQWDSSIRWQPTIRGKHSVYLQVDILNVLNKTRKNKVTTISTSDEYGVYTPGREFWLEVGYQF